MGGGKCHQVTTRRLIETPVGCSEQAMFKGGLPLLTSVHMTS